MKKYFILYLSLSLIIPFFSLAAETPKLTPGLLLAKIYHSDIKLQGYWVSEKLDGVRAYWDGTHLISRQGHIFFAPDWFIKDLPETTLDGELWLARGTFEQLSGLVRRQSANILNWKEIKFMVFDLPDSPAPFDTRLKQLEQIINRIDQPHIKQIKQFKVSTHQALMKKLEDIVSQGGEGLMLHSGASLYQRGRHDDLLKLKKYFDAEAIVIKHYPGKGKYQGMLGSLLVETADKIRFKIGTGFSDQQRKKPPAIGSTITYKYFGLTNNGLPRFASFLRIRTGH